MLDHINLLAKNKLIELFAEDSEIELAILVGSQVTGNTTPHSDWDIAIRWVRNVKPMQQLGKTESLRRLIAKQLNETESKIDLIDISQAGLTMRAVIVEEGLIVKGEESLVWIHFLQRTWRELESYYWNDIYAT